MDEKNFQIKKDALNATISVVKERFGDVSTEITEFSVARAPEYIQAVYNKFIELYTELYTNVKN